MKRVPVPGLVAAVAVAVSLGLLFSLDDPAPRGTGRAPTLSGAGQAMEFLARQRAYPGRDLPRSGYAEAFTFVRDKMQRAPAAKTGGSTWQAIGPHNIGGRTLCIAFNPQNPTTVWAGSASGGLWRSYTGGVGAAAWERVETGHPVLGVGSIAFAPGDSLTIYIGTGEVYSYDDTQGGLSVRLTRGSFGIGVLRSTNGGATWHKSLDWSYDQQRGVQVVRVDPIDRKTVWAGTTEGVYKTTDGGSSWIRMNSIPMVTDLVIHTAHPDTVVIAAGNLGSAQAGIYRTIDGGLNWTRVAQNIGPSSYLGKAQLAVCTGQPDVMYVSIGNGGLGSSGTWLGRSQDAGSTWVVKSTSDYSQWQGWFSHDVAVSPTDPFLLMAVGIDIWRSVNGGASLAKRSDWRAWIFGQVPPGGPEGPPNYSHADHHDVVWHPTNPDIVYFANDGGIFRSLNGGLTFAGCNGGYQTQQFYPGFACSPTDPDLAIGGMQDNATAIYTGSVAWTRVIGGDGSCAAIDPTDDATLFGSYQYLGMLRSRDAGANWVELAMPGAGSAGFIAPYALGGPAEPGVIYAGGSLVLKSLDQGDTWAVTNGGYALDGNPALALEVSQANSLTAYVTTAPVTARAGVFRTLDGGATWTNVTRDLPDRYPVGLAIDPADDAVVWITFSGFGTSHVFRTEDWGATWQDIGAGLPDVPTQAVIVDPLDSQNVYVGTDLGVFATVNSGQSWFAFSEGLPGAIMVMDLAISPSDRTLRIASHGNGSYERPLLEPVTGSPDVPAAVADVQLHPARPNPFNPLTEIAFELPRAASVRLAVFDPAGRLVRVLAEGARGEGRYAVIWDGSDHSGRPQSSGVYLVRLEAEGTMRTRRITLVR
ncbi:hypothetical protein KJ682_12275 [bacterium]|nr:hypothetical protein [bacterium]